MLYPGTQFGPYYVERELGRGGMAIVYHAVDERTGGEVALKVLQPTLARNPALLQRFKEEGENALRLRHPNIVRTYESNVIDNTHYIAMNYATKGTLSNLLNHRPEPISLEETVQILRRVALALDYAHSRNILHRDVKPSNILIGPSGQIWLADFGLAKRLDGEITESTIGKKALGTPAYMSPERVRREREIDARSDIYSLGVIAYSMLTGEMPFVADSQATLLRKITREPPDSPQDHNPQLAAGTCYVLEKVLSKSPALRYATAGEFIDTLEKSVAWLPTHSEWSDLRNSVSPKSANSAAPVEEPPTHKQEADGWLTHLTRVLRQPLPWLIIMAGAVAVLLLFQLLSSQAADTTPVNLSGTTYTPPLPLPTQTEIEATIVEQNVQTAVPPHQVDPFTEMPAKTATATNIAILPPTLVLPVTSTAISDKTRTAETGVQTDLDTPGKATSTPVPEQLRTATPTREATRTATPTPRFITPRPTATTSGMTSALVTVLRVRLVAPNDGDTVNTKRNFSWQIDQIGANGDELPEGFAFEAVFWRPEEDPLLNGRGWGGSTTGTALNIDLTRYLAPGRYLWGVRLVELSPFRAVRLLSEARSIVVYTEDTSLPHGSNDFTLPPTATPDRSFRSQFAH